MSTEPALDDIPPAKRVSRPETIVMMSLLFGIMLVQAFVAPGRSGST